MLPQQQVLLQALAVLVVVVAVLLDREPQLCRAVRAVLVAVVVVVVLAEERLLLVRAVLVLSFLCTQRGIDYEIRMD